MHCLCSSLQGTIVTRYPVQIFTPKVLSDALFRKAKRAALCNVHNFISLIQPHSCRFHRFFSSPQLTKFYLAVNYNMRYFAILHYTIYSVHDFLNPNCSKFYFAVTCRLFIISTPFQRAFQPPHEVRRSLLIEFACLKPATRFA